VPAWISQSNYLGGTFVDTEHAGRHNRVGGGDLSLALHETPTVFRNILLFRYGC
jgi:hypothetical protein